MVRSEADHDVDIRVRGRADLKLSGRITKVLEAGQRNLPSPALGMGAGGKLLTAQDDKRGMKAAESFFEICVRPDRTSDVPLLKGQRVVVRFTMPAKPLAWQWWRSLRQLLQKRFKI